MQKAYAARNLEEIYLFMELLLWTLLNACSKQKVGSWEIHSRQMDKGTNIEIGCNLIVSENRQVLRTTADY